MAKKKKRSLRKRAKQEGWVCPYEDVMVWVMPIDQYDHVDRLLRTVPIEGAIFTATVELGEKGDFSRQDKCVVEALLKGIMTKEEKTELWETTCVYFGGDPNIIFEPYTIPKKWFETLALLNPPRLFIRLSQAGHLMTKNAKFSGAYRCYWCHNDIPPSLREVLERQCLHRNPERNTRLMGTNLINEASAKDKIWFQSNPEKRYTLRDAAPNEFDRPISEFMEMASQLHPNQIEWECKVLSIQIKPGVRTRTPVIPLKMGGYLTKNFFGEGLVFCQTLENVLKMVDDITESEDISQNPVNADTCFTCGEGFLHGELTIQSKSHFGGHVIICHGCMKDMFVRSKILSIPPLIPDGVGLYFTNNELTDEDKKREKESLEIILKLNEIMPPKPTH